VSLAFATCLATLLPVPATAGGLYIREFGHPSQGTAGAGSALAEDASTAFTNPAGVVRLEGDSQWMVTGIGVFGSVEFEREPGTTIPGNDGGDAGGALPGAALFHSRRLSENWGLGVSLLSISGAALDYDFGFVDRYTGDQTKLLTVNFTPTLAYRVSDTFSVAAGPTFQYGRLDLDAAIPRFVGPADPASDGRLEVEDGDDLDVALAAAALWQATPQLRLGLAYLGETTLTFDGDADITLPGVLSGVSRSNIATDITFTLPHALRASAVYEHTPQLAILGTVAWEQWSSLDSIPVSTNVAGSAIPLDWDDTWGVALGFRYHADSKWTWYGGIAYDMDPTEPSKRIGILPVDRQWRLAAGVKRHLEGGRTLGAVLTYADLGSARIDRTTDVGRIVGEYDTNRAIFAGINYGWR
jgi:long-chain fatty acid transport protein